MYGKHVWGIGFHSNAETDWTDVAASAVVVSCGWDRKSGRTAGLLVRLFPISLMPIPNGGGMDMKY